MTFEELIKLLNEADEKLTPDLTPDEYAALLAANQESANTDLSGELSNLDIDADEDDESDDTQSSINELKDKLKQSIQEYDTLKAKENKSKEDFDKLQSLQSIMNNTLFKIKDMSPNPRLTKISELKQDLKEAEIELKKLETKRQIEDAELSLAKLEDTREEDLSDLESSKTLLKQLESELQVAQTNSQDTSKINFKIQQETKLINHLQDKLKTYDNLKNKASALRLEIGEPESSELDAVKIQEERKKSLNTLNTLKSRMQVMSVNLKEEEKRVENDPIAAEYDKDISDLERFVRHRVGKLRSVKQVSVPFSTPSEPETAQSLAAKIEEIRAEARRRVEVEQEEIRMGVDTAPSTPDPTGIANPQIFNQGIAYKRITLTPWNYKNLSSYMKDPKSGEWKSVSKGKAYNVPRTVSKVFNAVVESPFSKEHLDRLDSIFSEYMDIYNKILELTNTYKFGRERVEYLETRLDIAENVMAKNALSRIDDLEKSIAALPAQVELKKQQIRDLKRRGGTEDEIKPLIGELRLLLRDLEDTKEKFKGPQEKGAPRDVFSERLRLKPKYESAQKAKEEAEKNLLIQQEVTKTLHSDLQDESLTTAKRDILTKTLEQEGKKEIELYNDWAKKDEELRRVEVEINTVQKRIDNYERKKLESKLSIVGSTKPKEAGSTTKPTIERSRQFSSIAFELKKQKDQYKRFNFLVDSIKYGKVVLKELSEEDDGRVIQRDGELVLPYTVNGKSRFQKILIKKNRDKEEKYFSISGYRKGLDGYGGRPGKNQKNYDGDIIKGYGDDDGYYQTLEKCQKALEDLSNQLNLKRDDVLASLYDALDEAVGGQFTSDTAEDAVNTGINAVKAWVGLKKLQKAEQQGVLKSQIEGRYAVPVGFSLAQFTVDPVASLNAFYRNARVRKMRRLDTRVNQLSDITKQLVHITRSLPSTAITDFYTSSDDKRLNDIYKTAFRDALGAANATGDERLTKLVKAYFERSDFADEQVGNLEGPITKTAFLDKVKEISNTPLPEPENVVPFVSQGVVDFGKDVGDELLALMNGDVDAAMTPPTLTAEEEKTKKDEIEFFDGQLEKLYKLHQQPPPA